MELLEYLRILGRRRSIIIVTTLFAAIAVAAGVWFSEPAYTATTTLRLSTPEIGGESFQEYDTIYGNRLMLTMAELAKSDPVQQEVLQRLGIEEMPTFTITVVSETELLEISVEDPDPVLAQNAANALAESLVAQRAARENKLTIIERAGVPEEPKLLTTLVFAALGIVAGVVGGVALAFVIEGLDTKLHTTEQVEAAMELTLLGEIPQVNVKRKQKLMDVIPYAEAVRRLRTNIFSLGQKSPINTLLLTSAEPEEGKSALAASLAMSIARTGRKVIIVDTDLRQPALHTIFGLENNIGLSQVLSRQVDWSEVIRPIESSELYALTSGPTPANLAEMLSSDVLPELMEALTESFDMVVIDAAAFMAVADAAVLAPLVDGVLIVVRRNWAKEKSLLDTRQQLSNVGANVLGIVVNRARTIEKRYRKYYHHPKTPEVLNPNQDSSIRQENISEERVKV